MIFLMVLQNVPTANQDLNSKIRIEDLEFDNLESPQSQSIDRVEDTILSDIDQVQKTKEIAKVVEEEEVKPDAIFIDGGNINFGRIYTTSTESSIIPHLEFLSSLNTTSIVTQDVNMRSALNLTLNLTASGNIDLSIVPIDYALVLDWSGSVGASGWQQTVNWAIGFVNSLKVTDRISIIRFSTDAINMHSLTDRQDRPYIVNLLRSIGHPTGWTSTKDAVNATLIEFKDNSDAATPKFMFMVTDGQPYGAPLPETPDPNDREDQDPCPLAPNLRDEEIATLILGVGSGWNQQLIECLVEDPVTDLIRIQDYNSLGFDPEDLSSILGNLANTTAFNINLTLVFNLDVNLLQFSETPVQIVNNNVTWSFDKMKDNGTKLISVILDISGEGTVPIYTEVSSLEYQPVNQSAFVEYLEGLNVDITVEDVEPPIIAVPPDFTVEAQSIAGTAVYYAVVAYDLKDGNLIPDCSPVSGVVFPLGDTIVTCSATDYSGNSASASFVITVADTTPPNLILPADITVEADGPTGTTLIYSITAYDLLDGQIIPRCIPDSGSTFPLGTTYISCIATDSFGNSAHGTFSIIVIDIVAPMISNPDDVTIFEGISDGDVVWDVSDDFPDYYELYLNDVLIKTDTWKSGDTIEANVTELTNGTYLYHLVVYDTSRNFAVDEVLVTVLTIYDQFEKIRNMIVNLDMSWSKTNVLLGKLDLAIKDFENGNYDKAVKHLNTLIKNLNAFTKCKKYLEDAVDALINEINNLIQQIELFEQLSGSNDHCYCHCK